MSTTAAQAATAATLAMLNAPTPWHPRDANSRTIMTAHGHPRVHILPVPGSSPAEDHALAAAIAQLINEAAGVEPEAAGHVEPRPGRPVFGRRVGGVAGA